MDEDIQFILAYVYDADLYGHDEALALAISRDEKAAEQLRLDFESQSLNN